MKIVKYSKNALIYDKIIKNNSNSILSFNEFDNYMNTLFNEGIKTFYIAKGKNSGNIVLFFGETKGFYVSHNNHLSLKRGIDDNFARLHGNIWDVIEEINF